MNTIQFKI